MPSDAAAMTLVGADRGRGGGWGGIVLCNWRKWFSPSAALMQLVLDNIVNLQMEGRACPRFCPVSKFEVGQFLMKIKTEIDENKTHFWL
jgi:hypothetical protein